MRNKTIDDILNEYIEIAENLSSSSLVVSSAARDKAFNTYAEVVELLVDTHCAFEDAKVDAAVLKHKYNDLLSADDVELLDQITGK